MRRVGSELITQVMSSIRFTVCRCIDRCGVAKYTHQVVSETTTTTTTTTTRVAVQTRGLVVHRFVSCSVCHRVNVLGLPILMATPADGLYEGGMRRPEGARARRERRQRAEARLRLRLVRDAAMLVAHRGWPRFDSQS